MSILESEGIDFDISVPVAIVGAGAAGLVAALSLADAGTTPMVLERDKLPSGSTGLSSGMTAAARVTSCQLLECTSVCSINFVDDKVALTGSLMTATTAPVISCASRTLLFRA